MKNREEFYFPILKCLKDFPCGPVVKTPWFHCRGHGLKKKKSLRLITVTLSLLQEQLLASIKDDAS